jgi:hypothetical protein
VSLANYKKSISDIKSVFNLAQTSHYQVVFGGFSSELRSYLSDRGVSLSFMNENAGLLCSSAQLPTTSFATADIRGAYTGVNEKFAHTRMYDPITLEFYVDSQYKVLKMFEYWMEFISSGSNESVNSPGYYYRMRYPIEYKVDSTQIIKFDKDYNYGFGYMFYGLFPISMSAPVVSYQASDILRVSVTFNYERYICAKTTETTVSNVIGSLVNQIFNNSNTSNTSNSSNSSNNTQTERLIFRTGQSLGNESGVRGVTFNSGNVNPTIR